MSLYRPAGRARGRTVLIAAIAALVVGLLAGFLLGRSTAPKPSLAEKVADLRASLAPAREGLELAATEYSQAVRSGRVVAPTEYGAAKSDVQRASDTVAKHAADIRALDAARAAALDRAMAVLRNAVSRRADPAAVRRLSDAASAALRAGGGGGGRPWVRGGAGEPPRRARARLSSFDVQRGRRPRRHGDGRVVVKRHGPARLPGRDGALLEHDVFDRRRPRLGVGFLRHRDRRRDRVRALGDGDREVRFLLRGALPPEPSLDRECAAAVELEAAEVPVHFIF